MTLVMTSLPLALVFSMFVHIRTRSRFALIGGNLTAQLTGSHRGIGSGINFASTPSLPPRRQRAPESLLADKPGGGGGGGREGEADLAFPLLF